MNNLFDKITSKVNEIDKNKILNKAYEITDNLKKKSEEINLEQVKNSAKQLSDKAKKSLNDLDIEHIAKESWDKTKNESLNAFDNSKDYIKKANEKFDQIQTEYTGKTKEERVEEKRLSLQRKIEKERINELKRIEEKRKREESFKKFIRKVKIIVGTSLAGIVLVIGIIDYFDEPISIDPSSEYIGNERHIDPNNYIRVRSSSILPDRNVYVYEKTKEEKIIDTFKGIDTKDPNFNLGSHCLKSEKKGGMDFDKCMRASFIKYVSE